MPKSTPHFADDPLLVAMGAAIRSLRGKRGMSQEALAHESEVERAYLSGIECGKQNCTVMTLSKIATAMGVSLTEVMRAAKI